MAAEQADPREPLSPSVRALFETMAARRAERVLEPKAMRANDEVMLPYLNAGAPRIEIEREIAIPGPEGGVRAVVFAPGGDEAAALPVLVYLHGGGFVIMSPDTHAKIAKELAIGSNAVVVSVDYRRAPEYPYPAPLDDCVAAFRWVRENAAEVGGDPARIAIAGDSAGGNLAAATTLRLLGAGDPAPRGVLMICPWTDLAMDTPSFRILGPDDPVIDDPVMELFRSSYAPRAEQWSDPFVSPLRGALEGFPPTCVVVGEIDPLRDDGVLFEERVREAGGEGLLCSFPGMPHDFVLFPDLEEAEAARAQMIRFLERVLK